ncbi:MAG TPA: hypothetical protein DC042_00255 [Bacteroidales bacterium]|nr:hypothetical protein [Bacteroidales bacterium]
MVKRILIATLATSVTGFGVGFLIMGVLLAEPMKEMYEAAASCLLTEPAMVYIVIANIVIALLFVILFTRMNVNTFKAGLWNGAWITFLMIVWFDVWMFASFDFMQFKIMVLDVIGNTVIGTVAGGVAGWVLGKIK